MRPGSTLRGLLGRRRSGGGGGGGPSAITGAGAAQFASLIASGYAGSASIGGTAAASFASLLASGGATGGTPQRSLLAMNMPPVTYYDSVTWGLDLGMQRGDWGNGGGDGIPLTADGWPTQVIAGSGVYAGWQARILYPGQHVALWQGDGEVGVNIGGSVVSSSPGRAVLQLDGSNGGGMTNRVGIIITRSNVANPVRNLVVVPIANEFDYATKVYPQRLLDVLAPFGVLRFLDPHGINNIDRLNDWPDPTPDMSRVVVNWADRTTGSYALQSRRQGLSHERSVDLCRLNQSHYWFQIPIFATTNWMDNCATFLASYAPTWMHFYFAYGNELWNDAFWNGTDAQNLAVSRYGFPNEYDSRFGYQAMMGRYLRQALINAGVSSSRLHHVLESQNGFVQRNEIIADWQFNVGLFTDGQRAYQHAQMMAVAPYYSYERAYVAGTFTNTVPQVIATMLAEDVPAAVSAFASSVAAASLRGLPMGLYEAGQHLYYGDFGDTAAQQRLNDINQHANMYGLTYAYLDQLYANGWAAPGAQFHLAGEDSQFGRWGHMNDIRQTIGATPRQTPKMDALVQWGIDNPE